MSKFVSIGCDLWKKRKMKSFSTDLGLELLFRPSVTLLNMYFVKFTFLSPPICKYESGKKFSDITFFP